MSLFKSHAYINLMHMMRTTNVLVKYSYCKHEYFVILHCVCNVSTKFTYFMKQHSIGSKTAFAFHQSQCMLPLVACLFVWLICSLYFHAQNKMSTHYHFLDYWQETKDTVPKQSSIPWSIRLCVYIQHGLAPLNLTQY